MDALTCRSPRTCPTCEHWKAAGCELERQIALAFAPRAAPTPITARAPALATG